MVYGQIKKLLSDNHLNSNEMVLIESNFLETSRTGKYLRSVILAIPLILWKFVGGGDLLKKVQNTTNNRIFIYLYPENIADIATEICPAPRLTNKNFAIASMVYCIKLENNNEDTPKYNKQLKLYYLYSLDVVKIFIFKQHIRSSLKAVTTHGVRYFEIANTRKKKIYWDVWCGYIKELNSETKLWPFKRMSNVKIVQPTWLDKHLYLGDKRATEDKNRPVPVPGLGDNVEVKSLYVKPQYFGHWDESEYWIQCGYNTMINNM